MDYPRDLGQVDLWQESLERSLARRGRPKRSSVELYRLRGERDLTLEEVLLESAQYSQLRRRAADHPLVPRPAAAVGGVSALTLLAVTTLPGLLGGRSATRQRVTYAASLRGRGRVARAVAAASLQPRSLSARALAGDSTPVAFRYGAGAKVVCVCDSVRELQRRLGVVADGDFGPITLRAVRGFQASHGLIVDGIVGPATRAALGLSTGPILRANPIYFPKPVRASRHVTRTWPRPAPTAISISDSVRQLQCRLGVVADGEFGPITLRAVRGFQASHGLVVDGIVGPATRAATGLSAGPILRADWIYFPKPVKPVHRVSISDSVRQLQRRLGVVADGEFGSITLRAVRRFQAGHGLVVDGIVGPATRAALGLPAGPLLRAKRIYFPKLAKHVRHVTRIRIRRALRAMSIRATIRLMQQRLGVPADGQFGPITLRAVKAFQSRHGLVRDGVVGPATRAALGLAAGPVLRRDRALFPRRAVHHFRRTNGYANPLAQVSVTPERIDMGVDYAGTGTLTSIGLARVNYVGTMDTGWPGAFIEYQLLKGPDAGRYVYYAEGVRPAGGIYVGRVLRPGQPVAYLIPGWPTGVEVGWGAGDGTATLAEALGERTFPTPSGESFSALIASLGAPPGIP